MIRYERRIRAFAVSLAVLAGYVDSLGFLKLNGFFVSFMSGNSTRLGVGLAHGPADAAIAGTLIASFVAGVVLGTLTGHFCKTGRGPAVLSLVAVLLAIAALFDRAGSYWGAVTTMAIAMGAENAIFERNGEVSIGVTYMTGTLVKLGQRLCEALLGGNRLSWIWYLLLWGGLVAGATLGTFLYPRWGLQGLWLAVMVVVVQALLAFRLMVQGVKEAVS
jgi:uncharacterized membrane protein YoaK (UPF0700 family)